jgi:rSAM/selenodomain-associated transferase 1
MAVRMIAVLTRVPLPGHAKTRLIPALGPEGAAALAAAMAHDVLETVRATGLPTRVCVAGPIDHRWVRALDLPVEAQPDGDLGARIAHALRDGGVAIGTDAPTLPLALLTEAHDALHTHDVVLSPAEDGGYVLVGCSTPAGLFDAIPWSTAGTLAAQVARVTLLGRTLRMLPGVADVDTPEDLARLGAALASLPSSIAPRTRAFLESRHAAPLR